MKTKKKDFFLEKTLKPLDNKDIRCYNTRPQTQRAVRKLAVEALGLRE